MNRRDILSSVAALVPLGLLRPNGSQHPKISFDEFHVLFHFSEPDEQLVRVIYDDHMTTRGDWILFTICAGSGQDGWHYIEAGICRIEDAKKRSGVWWRACERQMKPSNWEWLQ